MLEKRRQRSCIYWCAHSPVTEYLATSMGYAGCTPVKKKLVETERKILGNKLRLRAGM